MLHGLTEMSSSLADPVLQSQWFVVAKSSDVIIGKPVQANLLGIDVVLWRTETAIHAWRDLCIHRGAKLSLGHVQDDCLVCPYHGWKYADTGSCVFIPAQPDRTPPLRARADAFFARERYGLVWICVGQPAGDIPNFPMADDPSFRCILCGPYRFEAKGPRLIENFVDVGHLPIVHGELLGDPAHAIIADYEIHPGDADGEGPYSGEISILQPDPDGTGRPGEVSYRYKVHAPLTASFIKSQGSSRQCILDTVTPISENVSEAWAILALNYAHDTSDKSLQLFQDKITLQDKLIVESQRPELLPLDLQEELHLRSDRMAIAYRTWLKTTNMKYGIA